MAFTGNYSCNSFRSGLLTGQFNFGIPASIGQYKLALYTNTATLNADTTQYTSLGEASGGNYVAGGQPITPVLTTQGNVSFVNFSSPSWTGAITARGALLYWDNLMGSTYAVCVLDFGSDKTSVNTFEVQMPANTSSSALIRLI